MSEEVEMMGWSEEGGEVAVPDDPEGSSSHKTGSKRKAQEEDESWGPAWAAEKPQPTTAPATEPTKAAAQPRRGSAAAATAPAAAERTGKGKGKAQLLESFRTAAVAATTAARTAAEFARSAATAFDEQADKIEECLAAAAELGL